MIPWWKTRCLNDFSHKVYGQMFAPFVLFIRVLSIYRTANHVHINHHHILKNDWLLHRSIHFPLKIRPKIKLHMKLNINLNCFIAILFALHEYMMTLKSLFNCSNTQNTITSRNAAVHISPHVPCGFAKESYSFCENIYFEL